MWRKCLHFKRKMRNECTKQGPNRFREKFTRKELERHRSETKRKTQI